MADTEYECNPTCLPCENTAQIANSVLSYRTAVLDLLCRIRAGGGGGSSAINILQFIYDGGSEQLSAGEQIPVVYTITNIEGFGGPVTLTSTPSIPAPALGTFIILIGQDDTNTVTLQSEATLPGSGLLLGAATRTLGSGDTLTLLYTFLGWLEIAYSDNN